VRFQFLALALPAVGIASSMAITVVSVPTTAQIPFLPQLLPSPSSVSNDANNRLVTG
jgi:moderate conductance mechanosensitive channel